MATGGAGWGGDRARHAADRPPPEPLGDRPAAFVSSGDVWQRQGPPGTATWYPALPPRPVRGWTWEHLWARTGFVMPVPRPDLPDLAYTTDSIPVIVG